MKDFDNSLITQIQNESAVTFWLVEFSISDTETVRYTTMDIDLFWDSESWGSEEFKVDPVNYAVDLSVDKLRLNFANTDLAMSSILLNYTLATREAIVYFGAMDGYTPIAEEVFRGLVSEWNLSENATITIANELVFWNKSALRLPGDLCPWPFKGTECGYSGAQTLCNKTYDRCVALGQSDNFGGFRFLPSLEEKQIWWGKEPA